MLSGTLDASFHEMKESLGRQQWSAEQLGRRCSKVARCCTETRTGVVQVDGDFRAGRRRPPGIQFARGPGLQPQLHLLRKSLGVCGLMKRFAHGLGDQSIRTPAAGFAVGEVGDNHIRPPYAQSQH